LWLDQKDDLLAGRATTSRNGLTVDDLCQQFLQAKKSRLATGELQLPTWNSYRICCRQVVNHFDRHRRLDDMGPQEFQTYRSKLAKTNGLVGLNNQIVQTRMIFQFAYKANLIERPIEFGPDFSIPSSRSIRTQRTSKMFEASEIRSMLAHGTASMRAMVLLGINGGLGNTDVERLNIGAIDFRVGWLTYPRAKTGTERRIPLWPETLAAIRRAIEIRVTPVSEDLSDRLFLTRRGESYHKDTTRYLTEQFRKFLQTIDAMDADAKNIYRKGVGLYALRHVFETIGGQSRDQVAVDAIMGHQRGDMASI
jgi:integrase